MTLEIALRFPLQILFDFDSSRLPELQKALEDVKLPEVEKMVRDRLDRAIALMNTLEQERSSPNFALSKADVLEWDAKARSQGMLVQKSQLKQELATLLGIKNWKKSYPSGSIFIEIPYV